MASSWSVGVDALPLIDPMAVAAETGPSARSVILRGAYYRGAWRISLAGEWIDRHYAAGTNAKNDTGGLVRMVGAGAWASADHRLWGRAVGTGPMAGSYAHLRGFRYRWSDPDLDLATRRDVVSLSVGAEASWPMLFLERLEVDPYLHAGPERRWIRHLDSTERLPWDGEYQDPWTLDLRVGVFAGVRF